MSVTGLGSAPRRQDRLPGDKPRDRVTRQLLLAASVLAFPVWGLAAVLPPAGSGFLPLLAVLVFAAATALAAFALRNGFPYDTIGACNLVTLARAALASVFAAPVALAAGVTLNAATWWMLFAIALVAFLLDGVDGWLARRGGMTSAFGARFDIEVDALLAVLLAVLAFLSGKAGAWVLILGLLRYAFVAASAAVPWLAAPLPQSMRRKVIAVLQIAILVALLAPPIGPPLSVWLAAVAAVLLVWSFAVDILRLYRQPR